MDDLRDKLSNLCLDSLPADWVESLWKDNFENESDLPVELVSEVELDVFKDRMSEAILAMHQWINEGKRLYPDFPKVHRSYNWHLFIDWDINSKSLLSFFSTFIKHDITDNHNFEVIVRAFTAARLYVAFLNVPGAAIFNMFHQKLFDQTMELLKIANVISCNDPKPKKSKSKKAPETEDEDNEEDQTIKLTRDEKEQLIKEICLFLSELHDSLHVLQLKREALSLNTIIQALVNVIFLERKSNVFVTQPKVNTIPFAVLKVYSILEQLCSESHGNMSLTIRTILKAFSKVLYYNKEDAIKLSGKEDDFMRRAHMLFFVRKLLTNYEANSRDFVFALLQQLLMRIPDKADIRANATTEVAQFLESLSPDFIEEFSIWAVSLSVTGVVQNEVAAVELIAKLLCHGDNTESKRLHELYLTAILSSTLDRSALVRYKCLNIFAANVFSTHPEIRKIMSDLFITPTDFYERGIVHETDFFNFCNFFDANMENPRPCLPDRLLPPGNRVVKLLEKLVFDDKVYVRKSALLALANICLLQQKWINYYRLKILVIGCKDISVMIRKQMIKCICDLLIKYPLRKDIVEAFVDGVIALIADNDIKCQEKVFECLYDIVIENIIDAKNPSTPESNLPWSLMRMIVAKEKRGLFRLACRAWSNGGSIKEPIFRNIISHIHSRNSVNSKLAWFYVVTLSDFLDFPEPDFIFDYFFSNVFMKNSGDDSLDSLVLESLFLNWRGLNSEAQEFIYQKLNMAVENFEMPLHLIARSLDILFQMKPDITKEFCGLLTVTCGKLILSIINSDTLSTININIFCRYIYTLGDAASFKPGVEQNVITCVADMIEKHDVASRIGKTSTDWKAVCVLTLCKLCLQDHMLAKKYVPQLSRLLDDKKTSASVKINALAGLADLCVRFTSVVEDFLAFICIALKDKNKDVRKSALEHIIQLIMEDYLKLKSPLFFYLLTMLLDPCPEIREIYESFIMSSVLKKQPSIMAHYFIQTIFFLNNFEGPKGIDKSEFSPKEKALFGLAGVNNFSNRELIYKFMLRVMEDDQRFRVQNRICIDILDGVCENKIELNNIGKAVLKDALNVMACKEMRLEHLRKDDDEQPAEDNLNEHFVIGMAKKMLLNQILKKNYVESLVPVVARLKRKLMDLRSSLAKDLMICVREIMKDYKPEVKEIFAADPELAAEVAFDLKNVSVENSLFEEFEGADIELQERISCISKLAFGDDMDDFMNTTIQQMIGDSDGSPSPIHALQQLSSNNLQKTPIADKEPGPSQSPKRPDSKIESVRRKLPIFTDDS